jgi:hypothetical protein
VWFFLFILIGFKEGRKEGSLHWLVVGWEGGGGRTDVVLGLLYFVLDLGEEGYS